MKPLKGPVVKLPNSQAKLSRGDSPASRCQWGRNQEPLQEVLGDLQLFRPLGVPWRGRFFLALSFHLPNGGNRGPRGLSSLAYGHRSPPAGTLMLLLMDGEVRRTWVLLGIFLLCVLWIAQYLVSSQLTPRTKQSFYVEDSKSFENTLKCHSPRWPEGPKCSVCILHIWYFAFIYFRVSMMHWP